MEWLKQLIEKAEIKDNKLDIEALMRSINAEFPKQAIPKTEYNNIKTQLKTANDTITTLKESNADNDTLQIKIKEHEDTIKTLNTNHKTELENLKKTSAINNLLLTNKAKYPDLLKDKFDLSKVKFKEDGSVDEEVLKEQLTTIKESYKEMFSEEQSQGNDSKYKYNPGDAVESSTENSGGFVDIIKSNQSRR